MSYFSIALLSLLLIFFVETFKGGRESASHSPESESRDSWNEGSDGSRLVVKGTCSPPLDFSCDSTSTFSASVCWP